MPKHADLIEIDRYWDRTRPYPFQGQEFVYQIDVKINGQPLDRVKDFKPYRKFIHEPSEHDPRTDLFGIIFTMHDNTEVTYRCNKYRIKEHRP